MEIIESNEKIKNIMVKRDLRQSENWAEYLSWLKWNSFRTSSGINVEIMPSCIGGLVKVQHPKNLSKEDLDEIEQISLKNKGVFIKIEPMAGQDTKILEDFGYISGVSPLAPPSTIYIDLSLPEENLWKNISKSGRYSIRHSDAKVVFHRNPSDEMLETFYNLAKETASTQGFSSQSMEDLIKKRNIFKDKSYLIMGYDQNNTLLGGKFFLAVDDAVWYLHAGTNSEGRKSDAGHKMMWEAFLYFKNLGYKVMDLDGIDDPRYPRFTKNWGGFSYFKEKFGGTVIRFPEPHIKYLSPVFKILNKIKRIPL